MIAQLLRINDRDNVAVALQPLAAGTEVDFQGGRVTARSDIPRGHKVALAPIAESQYVIKYGNPIGHATRSILPGDWVHVENLRTNLAGKLEYDYHPVSTAFHAGQSAETFRGFLRPDGQVGIRNELWILPTVGCVNSIADALVEQFRAKLPVGSVDGVFTFKHPYGCSQLGDDLKTTQKILADLAQHPNAGGVLVIGLGCENNTLPSFQKFMGDYDARRFRFLVTQQTDDEMEAGLRLLQELAEYAGQSQREPVPVGRLRVGLKCGGSDGFSGITANPLVGAFSDKLIAAGGATVLTEVPEMFGAETLLMNRCISPEVFTDCVGMVNGFKEYFLRHNQVVYENPSPGNKDGGISTLEEKSLGCIQKGGSAAVVKVLEYGARSLAPGLNLLDGPGNDIVSVTALAASGAHLVLFTTGRGTPLGGPVPTLKIASNSDLANRKKHWIDFNAGQVLEGRRTEDLANELFLQVLAVANGELRTRNELNGMREIAIFKDGVTL